MSVRFRRLTADYQMVRRCFGDHPTIRLLETEGDPPERYRLEYRLRGLVIQAGKVTEKDCHQVEIFLTIGYPRQAPQCRMLSPIYHPNIAPHAVCIGDHWSAGESLAALIARVGEMITYQSYNLKSPLNGEAAKWAAENMSRLPVQEIDLSVDVTTVAPSAAPPSIPAGSGPSTGSPSPSLNLAAEAPSHPIDLAAAAMRGGDTAAAIRALDQAITLDPLNTEAWRLRGVARSMGRDRIGAAIDFEEALRLSPSHERADWMHRFIRDARG